MTTLSVSIRRYRWMFFLAALSVLAVTVLATNTAAWTTEDLDPAEKEYRSAFVYLAGGQYWRGESVMPSYTAMGISGNYRGYMSYPVSHLDDNAYIESATMTIIARNSGSFTLNVRVMDRVLHELDPDLTFSIIYKGTSAGTVSISTGLAYRSYSLDITGAALEELREVVAGEDDYLVIAFDHSSLGWVDLYARYIDLSGTHYTTLTLEYDDESPDVPTPTAQQPYVTGDHIPVSWSPVSDNPSGGNRGDVSYQVGVYFPGAPADNPYHTSPWIDTASWNLTGVVENINYTFRVRARDGSGFTSNWSAPVNTTVDNSPPIIPILSPLPVYSDGVNRHVQWGPSNDVGIGNVSYTIQKASGRSFTGFSLETHHTSERYHTFMNLSSNATYYYRVRSTDELGHQSLWSLVESSTQDNEPPMVPILISMPDFSSGNSSVLSWHPSYDGGVGVLYYDVRIAKMSGGTTVISETFGQWETQGIFHGLEDGETYIYRLKAVDGFGHHSEYSAPVSSTQDASPPTAPLIFGQPPLPEGFVTISWSPAIDHGIGVSHYEVWWYKEGPPGSSPMVASIDVIGQSLTLPDLTNGTWHFGATAVDGFGQRGPGSQINITIDGTPPTRPILEELPEFSKGTSITLRWNGSTDDDSGIDYYRVIWRPSTIFASDDYFDTREREVALVGLTEGVQYWYQVYAYDKAGNFASSSSEKSRQDASPPMIPRVNELPKYINSDIVHVTWQESPDMGVGSVQYRVHWDVVRGMGGPDVDLSGDSGWIDETFFDVEGLSSGLEWYFEVQARDGLGHVSVPSDEVTTTLDTSPPMVTIMSPIDMATLSGDVDVMGLCQEQSEDVYFSVDVGISDEGPWISLFPVLTETYPNGFIFQWDTTRFPDGAYVLMVSAMDEVGLNGTTRVNVSLANAHLTVSPTDIGFAVSGVGDATMVMVAVRNDGDSMARNLTVKFSVDMRVMKTRTGVDIEAHSYEVLFFELNKTGKRYVEVSVGSDLYETQSGGRFLETEEPEVEEVAEDDPAMALGIMALVLGVIALLISMLVARRLPVEVQELPVKDESTNSEIVAADDWVESGDEET